MREVQDSVLALLPVAPGPSKAQRGRPCHPYPLQYELHQMLATLRNRAKNRLHNESVLRITRANSPPGEDTLPGRHHLLPPPSPAWPISRPFLQSPPQSTQDLGGLYPNCWADGDMGTLTPPPTPQARWPAALGKWWGVSRSRQGWRRPPSSRQGCAEALRCLTFFL